jgi:hypothetical protein
MALSPETKRILEAVHWIFSCMVLGVIVYLSWKAHKQVEAVLLTIIGISAIFYYWIKWFKVPDPDEDWPPVINPCPDFLTLVAPDSTGDSKPVCMDFVGVSIQPMLMKKASPKSIPQAADADYNDFIFVVDKSGEQQTDAEYNSQLCLKVQSKGLTWAGVCE